MTSETQTYTLDHLLTMYHVSSTYLFMYRCNESDRTAACQVDEPLVTAHYAHLEEGMIFVGPFHCSNVIYETMHAAFSLISLTRFFSVHVKLPTH
jgi:hypothetical protein